MEQRTGFPHLRGRITADAAIIGGGFTGLTNAVLLSRCGLRVAVLEARSLGCGASAHCTGVVSMGLRTQYAALEKARGFAVMDACVATRQNALKKLREWANEADFGWQDTSVELCAANSQEEALLSAEAESLRRAGIQTIFQDTPQNPLADGAALCWKEQALVRPELYLQWLIRMAQRQKVRICEHSRVLSMDADTVYTGEGSVRAPYILIATGYPILNVPGYFFMRLEQRQNWKAGLRGEIAMEGVYADARGAYVLRASKQETVFQLNGARAGACENDQPKRLFRYAPKLGMPETEWHGGLEVYSADGLPFIGAYSSHTPNLYVAAGYGGEGILGSVMAAQALSARILGLPSQGYEIYAPQRRWKIGMPIRTAGAYLKGMLRLHHPRCPHMGCRLLYRPREKMWVCPCHGSQFDSLGRVLSAPAVQDADIGRH